MTIQIDPIRQAVPYYDAYWRTLSCDCLCYVGDEYGTVEELYRRLNSSDYLVFADWAALSPVSPFCVKDSDFDVARSKNCNHLPGFNGRLNYPEDPMCRFYWIESVISSSKNRRPFLTHYGLIGVGHGENPSR